MIILAMVPWCVRVRCTIRILAIRQTNAKTTKLTENTETLTITDWTSIRLWHGESLITDNIHSILAGNLAQHITLLLTYSFITLEWNNTLSSTNSKGLLLSTSWDKKNRFWKLFFVRMCIRLCDISINWSLGAPWNRYCRISWILLWSTYKRSIRDLNLNFPITVLILHDDANKYLILTPKRALV